jgi:sigma-E factor negative regulatory protein RseB
VIRYICISLFSVVCASAYGSESTTALQFLNNMANALQTLNYHGTVVYLQNGQIESMKIVHKIGEQGEFERVVHLSGEAREVIRTNDVVTCYFSDSQSVLVDKQRFKNYLIPSQIENYDDFAPLYTFLVDGEDRVAGKKAQVVVIIPKDNYRYGYRLWLDQSNWLLLKSEMRNATGETVEQLMFTDVHVVDSIPESMLKPGIASEKFTWFNGELSNEHDSLRQMDGLGWHAANLPSGYLIKDHYSQAMPGNNTPVEHMVISDGLATVSVYIEPFSAESQTFVGASNVGATNIFGSIIDDYHVTVVGVVPESTVQIIATSIRHDKVVGNH